MRIISKMKIKAMRIYCRRIIKAVDGKVDLLLRMGK